MVVLALAHRQSDGTDVVFVCLVVPFFHVANVHSDGLRGLSCAMQLVFSNLVFVITVKAI